jgi:hypothetical protein
MTMPASKTSGGNANRIAALKKVTELLRAAPGGLSHLDIVDAMKCSDSGAKGYIYALLAGNLIERRTVKDPNRHPRTMHFLIATALEVDVYLQTLVYKPGLPTPVFKAPPHDKKIAAKKPQPNRMERDPTRHFHVAGDDEPFHVRVPHVRIPPRDELVAALFGPAKAAA